MASTIVTKNSSTASAVPVTGDLTQGELAVNVTDKKLYTKDSGGTVVKLVGGLGNQEANAVAITGGSINGTTVGATTASTGAFTTLSASSTVSGTGFSTYLASPPAIGGTAAAAGSFTTLSASSTTTLSGGTANGVAYLNGSKVVTTGSALTFDGTNLGVGVTPSAWSSFTGLQVGPSGSVSNSGTGTPVSAFSNNAYYNGTSWVYINTAAAAQYQLSTSQHIWRYAASGSGNITWSEAMRLDTSGNLGIGTSSPVDKLEVYSTITARAASGTSALRLRNTTTDMQWQSVAGTNAINLYDNAVGSSRLTVDSSGNLGLGVTPSAWGSAYRTAFQNKLASLTGLAGTSVMELSANFYLDSTGTGRYIATDYATQYQQLFGAHKWYYAASGTAGNSITFTQAMTLDASGRLLIGNTTNSNGEALQIDANGVGSTLYTALFRNTSTSTSVYNAVRFLQGASGSAIGYIGTGGSAVANAAFANNFVVGTQSSSALVFNTNDTERARIDSSGNFQVGTAALATTATNGFLYIPTCAGTPTGTPTAKTGLAPIIIDSTNNKMYIYSGGAWVALN